MIFLEGKWRVGRGKGETLTVFYEFPLEIKRIVYITNLTEKLKGKIRKYTKNKMTLPTDDAIKKFIYLVLREATKKWAIHVRNWGIILNQILTIYE